MQLNYKSIGQGDPVIILHGLFGTLDNWQSIAKQLAEDYLVYIIDQRNHGRSPHIADINYELMAEDLHQFMEQQWIYHAHIMGHSMGGKTAMQFTLNYPDMVNKLVIVDIAPKASPGHHEAIFDALLTLDLQNISSRNEADEILAKKIDSASVRQFLLKNLSRNKGGGFQWKMNLMAIHQHYPDILTAVKSENQFDKPTLFVRGGRSDYITDSDWPDIKKLFPNAKLLTLQDAGHWVHADKPLEFLQHIRGFLAV